MTVMPELFDVNEQCPRCGAPTLFGWMYRDASGRHQHTRYACVRWPCQWIGWSALDPEQKEDPVTAPGVEPPPETVAVHQARHILQFFEYGHLPEHLQNVSRPFSMLAYDIVNQLPNNTERAEALRKLLEAKDCAVRALLFR